jgi:hypothetical protein
MFRKNLVPKYRFCIQFFGHNLQISHRRQIVIDNLLNNYKANLQPSY